jgi:hypothetical protein
MILSLYTCMFRLIIDEHISSICVFLIYFESEYQSCIVSLLNMIPSILESIDGCWIYTNFFALTIKIILAFCLCFMLCMSNSTLIWKMFLHANCPYNVMSNVFSSGDRQEHILSTVRMTYRPKWMDKGVLTLTWKSVVMSQISFCKL